jgi:site-specific DNA-methyltransferase (adenine-specific)
MKLILGDCLEKLKDLPDNSVDSIVTDPPYGLSFMGKKWDYDVPSVDIWKECLRVLKPGGHLLSFSGSRTYHRMAVRIEDAGFEIRDQIMWVYGSGFPKSHNIGKAVDKIQGNDREVVGEINTNSFETWADFTDRNEWTTKNKERTKGTSEWEGWGTALKPAHEPIVMARKPVSEKTNAENVLRWGTGGLNIDDCRIGYNDDKPHSIPTERDLDNATGWADRLKRTEDWEPNNTGRWPANIIFDEDAGEVLDQQSGIKQYNKGREEGNYKGGHRKDYVGTDDNPIVNKVDGKFFSDKGGASRFFYCPKASKKDRDEGLDNFEEKAQRQSSGGSRDFNARCANCGKKFIGSPETICSCDNPITDNTVFKKKNNHPTVKPTELMLYLIKLVTPKGGTVLEPFMGSGSTGKAAIRGGFDFIGIEKEEEYLKIAEARIEHEYGSKH